MEIINDISNGLIIVFAIILTRKTISKDKRK
jgi:hypothetical protein